MTPAVLRFRLRTSKRNPDKIRELVDLYHGYAQHLRMPIITGVSAYWGEMATVGYWRDLRAPQIVDNPQLMEHVIARIQVKPNDIERARVAPHLRVRQTLTRNVVPEAAYGFGLQLTYRGAPQFFGLCRYPKEIDFCVSDEDGNQMTTSRKVPTKLGCWQYSGEIITSVDRDRGTASFMTAHVRACQFFHRIHELSGYAIEVNDSTTFYYNNNLARLARHPCAGETYQDMWTALGYAMHAHDEYTVIEARNKMAGLPALALTWCKKAKRGVTSNPTVTEDRDYDLD